MLQQRQDGAEVGGMPRPEARGTQALHQVRNPPGE